MIKRALLAFLLLIEATPARATAIVASRTSESVVISSDSKINYKGEIGPPTICKLFQAGNRYFAVAGIEFDRGRSFYPAAIIAEGLSSSESFVSKISKVEQTLASLLLVELKRLQDEDIATYNYTIRGDAEVMSVLFVEVIGGVPYAAARGFHFITTPQPRIEINRITCPGDCPNGVELFYLGRNQEIKSFMADATQTDMSPAQLTRKLVELEIQAAPEDVGPPIITIEIDKNGIHRDANAPGCPVSGA